MGWSVFRIEMKIHAMTSDCTADKILYFLRQFL